MTRESHLNVLFVTTGLGTGGAEAMLCQFISGLDPRRFRASVVSLTAGGKHEANLRAMDVPVCSLGMTPGRPSARGLLRLVRAVRAARPAIIAGWMYHGNLAALLGKWLALSRAPVIWNIRQSLDSIRLEKRGSATIIRLCARLSRFAGTITYNSQSGAKQHEAAGFRGDKSLFLPNGFDTTRFAPSAEARASVRSQLGLLPEALLVGRFGRSAPMKDHAAFIAAAAAVSAAVPEAHFVMAGTGVDQMNERLTTQIRDLNLPARVHLLGERHDIPRLTAALDVACSSSAFGEGLPNVIGEAMACGVPCVSTDVGDSAWLAGDCGEVVPPQDPRALAAALIRVLQMPHVKRRAAGEAGRQRIADSFSLESATGRFIRLFTPPAGFRKPQPTPQPCAG